MMKSDEWNGTVTQSADDERPGMDEVGDGWASQDRAQGLIDVTDLPLSEIIGSEESALANSIRRLIADLGSRQEIIAGFSNYLS
jgi:FXSXX-COOH protein